MKKRLLILVALLLLTGCKAKYNLQINFGGNYIETGSVYINSTLLGKGGYSNKYTDFLKQAGKKYNFDWIVKKVPFSNGSYFGYDFYQRYSSASKYSNHSPALKSIFNGLSVKEENHKVKLDTRGLNLTSSYNKPTADFPSTIETIEINVSLPYKVTKHNANSVDTNSNTYTWFFNSATPSDKGINLEYMDNEVYTYNPLYLFKFVSPYIYISILLVIIILIVIGSVRTRSRFRNRI